MLDNAGVVERVIDALGRADPDAVLELSTEDVEFDFSNSRSPLSGVYRGREEGRAFLASFFEAWASVDADTRELLELGQGRVLSVTEIRTRGQGSGVEVNATGAIVWTVRDGELARATMYQSKAEALDALSVER